MTSPKPRDEPCGRATVLGADGTIDLTGRSPAKPSDRGAAMRPSGDAWLVDRSRRTLLPSAGPSSQPQNRKAGLVRDDIHREIADRFALGDYAAALTAADLQLGLDPDDEDARRYAETSRERLEARYTTRIGSLEFVFNLAMPVAKVRWLGLDPQAASLLKLVDGQTTVEEALELSQLERLDALRVFTELMDAGAIVRVA